MKYKKPFLVIVTLMVSICCSGPTKSNELKKIDVKTYQSKVYASWLGQCIGNIAGLPHENRYVDNPSPEDFPFAYQGEQAELLKEVNGAFSDDDTDIEYMYMLAMEKYNVSPTLKQLSEFWMHHVRRRVWLANRAALGAMHFGYTPPFTGSKELNPHWFQIDPQLINEVWAVTSPGMINYAAEKSAWASGIMCADWGIEPTVFYGAMYSAAFFESDINELINIGLQNIDEGGKFHTTVKDMQRLYNEYPDDYRSAWEYMAKTYYVDEPIETKTIWNANLNGAAAILALLYGQGDFQKTLDMSIYFGFDNDNQAATMLGLLGVANGLDGIPKELLFPFPELNWEKPFNDMYVNITRYDLPTVPISTLTERMAKMGERVILENGGQKITEEGNDYYLINPEAKFSAPLEIPIGPMPAIMTNAAVDYSFAAVGGSGDYTWELLEGNLPEGLSFDQGKVQGMTNAAGLFPIKLEVSDGQRTLTGDFDLIVRGSNLAPSANAVLATIENTDVETRDEFWLSVPYSLYNNNIAEVIRDGNKLGNGSVFYSITSDTTKTTDFYGYTWDEPVTAGAIFLHTGSVEEMGGWFNSLSVEYLDESGNWIAAKDTKTTPELSEPNNVFIKPHFVEYMLTFDPVSTKGIRIIGEAGGIPHWKDETIFSFTSITELEVYDAIPGL